jgi:hypothetical protein
MELKEKIIKILNKNKEELYEESHTSVDGIYDYNFNKVATEISELLESKPVYDLTSYCDISNSNKEYHRILISSTEFERIFPGLNPNSFQKKAIKCFVNDGYFYSNKFVYNSYVDNSYNRYNPLQSFTVYLKDADIK